MMLRTEVILSVFLALLLSSAACAGDAPFIVANKKVSLTRLKSGAEKVAVSIDIYNKGSDGNTSKSWERLDVESKVSHSFVLESKVKGMFYGAPAVIKYRVPSKAALQVAYSTPILPLDILAERTPEKKFDLVKRLVAEYGSLVSVLSMVTLFIFLLTRPSKSSGAKASKKKR